MGRRLAAIFAIALAVLCAPAARAADGLERITVTSDGLYGVLIVPNDGQAHPGILRLGGAEGGLATDDAEMLAAHGYAVLALAYFGAKGLPADLEEVPLEYFGKAVAWMKASPRIDKARLGIVGVSRGSTLTLLLPTFFDGFQAVVALAPAHVVWQSSYLDWSRYAQRSSYSWKGKALPFVPYDFSDEAATSECNAKVAACVRMYAHSLLQTQRVSEARIPVERMKAPVLLISGKSDSLWPSSAMSEEIVRTLSSAGYAYEYRHLDYDDAGHCAMKACFGGGTVAGNNAALRDIDAQVFAFLDRHLKAGRRPGA